MAQPLSPDEQDDIVSRIGVGLKTMDYGEMKALRDQLDADHKSQVDESNREFADNAIGDEHWDSDRVAPHFATPSAPPTARATTRQTRRPGTLGAPGCERRRSTARSSWESRRRGSWCPATAKNAAPRRSETGRSNSAIAHRPR